MIGLNRKSFLPAFVVCLTTLLPTLAALAPPAIEYVVETSPSGSASPPPCTGGTSRFVSEGTNDNFVGPEPTSPLSPDFQTWTSSLTTPSRVYDDGGLDRYFATTIRLPAAWSRDARCLADGWIEIRVRAEGSLSNNDGLALQFVNGAFLQSQGVPGSGVVTVPLDADVVQSIASQGYLDVYLQDDHAVDYARLVLDYA